MRTQLLKLLRTLPPEDVRPFVEKVILFVRAGMTNLSAEVSEDSMGVLEWALDVAAHEVVSAPGCWAKPLSCFLSVLKWSTYLDAPNNATIASSSSSGKWSSAPQASLVGVKKKQAYARQLSVFGRFLAAGLVDHASQQQKEQPGDRNDSGTLRSDKDTLYYNIYESPKEPGAFTHLNIFGTPRDEESQMYIDADSRRRIFVRRYLAAVIRGLEQARKEGGTVGRAANSVEKTLHDSLGETAKDALAADMAESYQTLCIQARGSWN